MFDRLRNTFRPAPTSEPGLVDHASQRLREAGESAHRWVYSHSPWAGDKITQAQNAAADLEAKGWSAHFSEFNAELLRPFTDGVSQVAGVVEATARCTPGQNSSVAFALWNVLCFWLGVAVLLIDLLLPGGSDLAEAVNVCVGYVVACTADARTHAAHHARHRHSQRAWLRL